MGEIMINTVRNNIIDYNLIRENDNIVVGVSGGADSMALLYVLMEIKKDINFNIFVAHVNHGVRGEDALSDQLFVERKAREMNIPYYFKNVDMEGYAKEKRITAEEAGRELRYGFFRDILKQQGGGKIAVAHNKNDQAETLLLRIMRGTGIDGLKGMEFIAGDVIRPILNITREDIETYINSNSIETVLDKTNLMTIYSRNKVRLELIPYIKDNFNPNIVNTLWRLSRISDVDSRFLNDLAEEKYNLIVKSETKHSIILDGTIFNVEDRSIKIRIIRLIIYNLVGSLQGISEQNVQSIVELFERMETGKQLNLPSGIIGRVSYNDLIIHNSRIEKLKDFNYKLSIGENEFLDLGISIKITIQEDNLPICNDKNVKYFDYDLIKGDLWIRNRKNGDKFNPYGMKGTKKVKDYFIDEKIPKDLRDEIPLLMDDENIIWILGFATSEAYRITEDTKNILIVDYKKI